MKKRTSLFVLASLVLLLAFALNSGFVPVSTAHAAAKLHGNKNSYIFHQPVCRYYDCKNCVVIFSSRDQAIASGFRPCKICRP